MEKLQTLVQTLEVQHNTKADYVIEGKLLVMKDGLITSTSASLPKIYSPNEVFHESASDKLGIPLGYYRRMRTELPGLLDTSVTAWLQNMAGKNVLLRTFEGVKNNIARAFLSDRYQAIDNYDVLFAVLDAIKSMGVNVEIKHADVTEKRLYLNVVAPEVEIQAKQFLEGYLPQRNSVGNGIISGFTITNSEVGCGQFSIRPRAVIIKCDNGLICPDDSFSRIHLGGKLEKGVINWSQETKNKNMELIMSQTRDAIKTYMSADYLGKMVEKIAAAHAIKLDHPMDTIQHVCKELKYTEAQRKGILAHFIEGADLRASGVTHAITRQAQDEDPDTRNDMEVDAFRILDKIQGFDKPFSGN
jgi:hypothetical protein